MHRTYNLLVTGVGAIIGYGIIESIRLANIKCKIFATDIHVENYGKYLCDEFIQVPYTSSANYKDIITQIVAKHNIDLIFPGIEQDVYYFTENHSQFNTQIVLNTHELVSLSKDKLKMYEFLRSKSYAYLIPTYPNLTFSTASEKLGLPFIIKPKRSYASKGFHVITSKEEFIKVANEIDDNTLFQPSIGSIDEEYTISIFGDGNGNYIDSIILRRYLSIAGASEKTYTVKEDLQLMKAVSDLVSIFKPVGPTNLQFRKQNGKAFLLEINPRISSACSLRTKFGYNDPLYSVQHYLENKRYTVQAKKQGKAIRYIADNVSYA